MMSLQNDTSRNLPFWYTALQYFFRSNQELDYITGHGAAAMQLKLKAQLLDAAIKSMRLTSPSSPSSL
jgi:hypothetical protein